MSASSILKSKAIRVLAILFSVTFIFIFFIYSKPDSDEDKYYSKEFNNNYSVYALDLPTKLTFANEKVPLSRTDISESLDRELLVNTYFQSQTLLFIKKANRYLPEVETILKEEGVPDDFKYLPFIESGYSNPTSPAGAVGYWQFLKGTAIDYGLEVNSYIDERYHLEKATRAACSFLKESYKKYNSWTLAAASYNMGRKRLSDELERQKSENYYDLLLNEETARYVFRLLAIKTILENPQKYGFHFRRKHLYEDIPTIDLKIDTPVTHFADFANMYGVNYKILKQYNPWLRNHYLPNTEGKEYIIKIPKK